jgi:hypothetical protein
MAKTKYELFMGQWKKDRSVIKQVYAFCKMRKSWDEGITFKNLKKEVEVSLRRSKPYSDGTIRKAISDINKFGKTICIYLRSSSGRNDEGKMEYRYYVPTYIEDINNEERDLDNRENNILIKKII